MRSQARAQREQGSGEDAPHWGEAAVPPLLPVALRLPVEGVLERVGEAVDAAVARELRPGGDAAAATAQDKVSFGLSRRKALCIFWETG